LTEPNRFRRQVLLNTASTGLANGWAMVVALVSLPLLLSGLGPTVFGTWVLVQTFSAITGWFSLADIGLGTAATRAIAERASLDDRTAASRITSSALAAFAALGLLCAGGLALAGPALLPRLFHTPTALRHDLRLSLVLFACQIMVDLLTEGAEACLEGLQRVDLSRGVDAVRRTTVAVVTVIAAQTNGHLPAVAMASLAASVVGALVAAVVLRRHLPAPVSAPALEDLRHLFAYGKTVAVLRPLGVLHRTMDRIIVGAVLGPAAVSLVEIATQVQNGAEAILSATAYAVVPTAAWLTARGDRKTMHELLHRGTKYSLLVTIPVGTVAAMLAGPLVRIWLGRRYGEAAGLAAVALLITIITAPTQVASNLLLGVGRATDILRAAGMAIVVNLVLSLVLVHITGIVGVFQATLLASIVLVPALLRSVLRSVGSDLSSFLRDAVAPVLLPTAALVAVTGIAVALPLSDLPTLAVGGVLGLGAYLAFALRWSVDRNELAELRSSIGRRPAAG